MRSFATTNPRVSGFVTNEDVYDVIIVGAGPVGLACAIAARRGGYRYLVIEKGCLVNSIFHFPVNMTFFTTPERVEIGNYPITTSHGKPTRLEALEYYRGVARVEQLEIHTYESVMRLDGVLDDFRVFTEDRDGPRRYQCRRVIFATGYYNNPNYLGIPGEDLPHVTHYYSEAHPFSGERVLVVGGRNSACEATLDLFRHGADVTLVHRRSELGATVKYWVRPDIENRIAAGEIRALFETQVIEIRPRSVVLGRLGVPALPSSDKERAASDEKVSGSKSWEEPFDRVFLLTGYHPDADLLRRCGLRPDPETLKVELDSETLECLEAPGIYFAGSAGAGRYTGEIFIENGRFDCEKIFRYLERTLTRKG